MKKILYVASRISHLNNFHIDYIKYFKDKGYEIHIMCQGRNINTKVDRIYDIEFEKKIISVKNINKIICIKSILEKEKYDLIVTNTTLAAFMVRIAKQISGVKNHGKLINICHGYLFSKNTPFIKKHAYILAEKLCVPSTDRLLTMNKEDNELAKKYHLCKGDIVNINGMGIQKPPNIDRNVRKQIREKYSIKDNEILMVYAGELSKRKNQQFLIESMPKILEKFQNIKLVLAGNGILYDDYKQMIKKLNLTNDVILAGYVNEIEELIYSADIAISSSKSEGLPFNIMQSLSLKTPVIASNIKGHKDLIKNGYNGYLFDFDQDELISKIRLLLNNKDKISENGFESVQKYYLSSVFDKNMKFLNIN